MIKTPVYLLLGHATAQAVGHQPLTAQACVQSQASSCSFLPEKLALEQVSECFIFSCHYLPT
jgi:hypothetical protein